MLNQQQFFGNNLVVCYQIYEYRDPSDICVLWGKGRPLNFQILSEIESPIYIICITKGLNILILAAKLKPYKCGGVSLPFFPRGGSFSIECPCTSFLITYKVEYSPNSPVTNILLISPKQQQTPVTHTL